MPERHVDVEHPAPVVVLGQPAAQGGPMIGPKVTAITQTAIARAWRAGGLMSSSTACDIGTSAAPHRPCNSRASDDLRQRLREPAEHGRDGETHDRKQEYSLAADLPREPAAQRRHDRGGDDVRGQHPCHLILGGGERALNARQRDVGDGVVERLHDRRQHDRHRDQRAARSIDTRAYCRAAPLNETSRPRPAVRHRRRPVEWPE